MVDYIFQKYLKVDDNVQSSTWKNVIEIENFLIEKLPTELKAEFDNYLKVLSKYELDVAKFIIEFTLETFFEFVKRNSNR